MTLPISEFGYNFFLRTAILQVTTMWLKFRSCLRPRTSRYDGAESSTGLKPKYPMVRKNLSLKGSDFGGI
jgi:hypothetical protein